MRLGRLRKGKKKEGGYVGVGGGRKAGTQCRVASRGGVISYLELLDDCGFSARVEADHDDVRL